MQNFSFQNPVKILFGEGQIAKIAGEIPADAKILVTYGGGSIKANGVYEQVFEALAGRDVREFGGIEPNPRYETLMRAVELVREQGVDFLLAVGGGSVLDGTKFIAAAARFEGEPWAILAENAPVTEALPLGAVLTLPATGSEMNGFSVVSREETREKRGFFSPLVYPRFSVLDPRTTFSLPPRQIGNGVVDAFVHTTEQYLTYPANTPLQDRFAEGILLTLIAEGPKTLADPSDYASRANVMWSATMALNGLIGVGVPQDWATHGIGHELTALFGLDHAQTLAVVLPSLLEVQRAGKLEKLAQYAERVWGLHQGTPEQKAELAIINTRAFFETMGVKTRLSDYGVDAAALGAVTERLAARGPIALGEHRDIDREKVEAILAGAV